MTDKDIRWKQRFQNFEKAYLQLKNSSNIKKPSDTERAGLIQFFEVALELSWKTLKDYLESDGFQVKTPRETFKQAYQLGLIEDGEVWLQALEDRNLTSHTYDESTSRKIERLIRKDYLPLLGKLYRTLKEKAA